MRTHHAGGVQSWRATVGHTCHGTLPVLLKRSDGSAAAVVGRPDCCWSSWMRALAMPGADWLAPPIRAAEETAHGRVRDAQSARHKFLPGVRSRFAKIPSCPLPRPSFGAALGCLLCQGAFAQALPAMAEVLAWLASNPGLPAVELASRSIDVIDSALHVFSPEEVCFSFNGGKDSTVVFHLLRAACLRRALADAGAAEGAEEAARALLARVRGQKT